MDDFNALNEAIIKRNMCARNARALPDCRLPNGDTWKQRADYWESEAEKHAEKLGTRIVQLPGTMENIITAELFLKMTYGTEG